MISLARQVKGAQTDLAWALERYLDVHYAVIDAEAGLANAAASRSVHVRLTIVVLL
jgi:hypothetical protein